MRKTFSDADQCLSFSSGHNLHHYAMRTISETEFLPATVSWRLGTNELEINCGPTHFLLANHNPHAIARALQISNAQQVVFCASKYVLRVQVGLGVYRIFSLADSALGTCLDPFEQHGQV